jgi:type II secretory pathway pseudopilin PulG
VKKKNEQSGFTLVEMLVAIAVAITFMGGMLLSRGSFDSTVRLSSIARDVALLARQAQTYGAGGGSSLQVGQPHGVYLDENNPREIKLYANAESSGSKGYEASSNDQVLDTLNLPTEYRIKDFCLDNNAVNDCASASSNPSDLSVYFVRPILEANFYSSSGNASSSSQAAIELEHSSSNATRIIKIDSTGFISTP